VPDQQQFISANVMVAIKVRRALPDISIGSTTVSVTVFVPVP